MKANEKVVAMVRRELERDPRVKNKALLAKAKRMDRSVGRLSPQQFHATYRLRVMREMAPAKPRKKAPRAPAKTPPPTVNRDKVQAVLLELMTEVAAADKASIVGVVASIDRYVDRVLGAT